MLCKQCGNEIKIGAVFCANCGARQMVGSAEIPENDLSGEKTIGIFEDASPDESVSHNINSHDPLQSQADFHQTNTEKVSDIYNEAPATEPSHHSSATQPQTGYQPSTGVSGQGTQPGYSQFVPATGMSNGPVSFGQAIKLFFTNYVNFTGRASKSEYWWAFLFEYLVLLAAMWIPIFGRVVALGMWLPGLSVMIRRFHDTGKAWYWCFMALIPLVGPILLIIFMCQDSDGDNLWGPAFTQDK